MLTFAKALKYGFTSATGVGIIVALFANYVTAIFTSDPLVTSYTQSYMWSVALTYGFLAAIMVEANAFQAIGRSCPGFWIFILRFMVISTPFAYTLTRIFHFSIVAIWGSLIASNIVAAIVGYIWIKKTLANLKTKQVPVHK
jgi:Na+-driven multidrug efflux pump